MFATLSLVLAATAGLTVGSVPIAVDQVWSITLHHLSHGRWLGPTDWTPAQDYIVWELRVPRILLGAVVGGGLALVGTALQALVRNPLADPYIFGITSGAAVGAAAVLVLGFAAFGDASLSLASFAGAVASFGFVILIARWGSTLSPLRMILAGVAVSYAMSAITSFLVYFAANEGDQGAALSVLFWMLGGLSGARWGHLALPTGIVLVGGVVLMLHTRALNTLLLGEETASTLGIDIGRFRLLLFALCTLLTGAMVSMSGGIGFVGLVVPHAVRIVVGGNHRQLLPVAMIVGASFLVWADLAARTTLAPSEIPIGIVTALVGAPIFIVLLRSQARRTAEARP